MALKEDVFEAWIPFILFGHLARMILEPLDVDNQFILGCLTFLYSFTFVWLSAAIITFIRLFYPRWGFRKHDDIDTEEKE